VATGIVSALNRYVRVPAENGQTAHLVGAIQTDASINPGNSGGALVDCNRPGFAIPVDFAKEVADELITDRKVTRPGFGMQVQPIFGGLFVHAVSGISVSRRAAWRLPGRRACGARSARARRSRSRARVRAHREF